MAYGLKVNNAGGTIIYDDIPLNYYRQIVLKRLDVNQSGVELYYDLPALGTGESYVYWSVTDSILGQNLVVAPKYQLVKDYAQTGPEFCNAVTHVRIVGRRVYFKASFGIFFPTVGVRINIFKTRR